MLDFIVFFMAALSAENLFFTRAFDAYGIRDLSRSPRKILLFGTLSTAVLLLAAPVAYGLNRLLFGTAAYHYINGIAHLLVLTVIYVAAYLLLKLYVSKVFDLVGKYLPFAVFNCATLGSLLLVAKDSSADSLLKALAYHLGAGVGFTGAMLLLWSLHQRLDSCKASKSFRGLPLELITVGLIALALVGLTGNQLPA